ncbi:MAG: hypothetical protein V2A64_02300 [Candidatus Omnitrophota bacterium]
MAISGIRDKKIAFGDNLSCLPPACRQTGQAGIASYRRFSQSQPF